MATFSDIPKVRYKAPSTNRVRYSGGGGGLTPAQQAAQQAQQMRLFLATPDNPPKGYGKPAGYDASWQAQAMAEAEAQRRSQIRYSQYGFGAGATPSARQGSGNFFSGSQPANEMGTWTPATSLAGELTMTPTSYKPYSPGTNTQAATGRYNAIVNQANAAGMQQMRQAQINQAIRQGTPAQRYQAQADAYRLAQIRAGTPAARWNEAIRQTNIQGMENWRQSQVNQYWADQRQRSLQADADRKTAEAYWLLGLQNGASSGGGGYGGGYSYGGGGGGGGYTSVPEWWLRMLSWNFG